MKDIIVALKDTPLSTLLVLAGIAIIILALAGEITGRIKVPPERQKLTGIVGTLVLVVGLVLYIVPPPRESPDPPAQPTAAVVAKADTLTPAPAPSALPTPSSPIQPTAAAAFTSPAAAKPPAAGTATIEAPPAGAPTGQPPAPSAVGASPALMTPGGPPIPVTITRPGATALLGFEGRAGQRVSLTATDNTVDSTTISIRKPDGKELVQDTFYSSSSGDTALFEPQTLPTDGTYTVLVDPTDVNTGKLTLTLYDVQQ